MNINVSALPLVLCGPILRRVQSHSVTVFIALKEQRWVQLVLYSGPSNAANNPTPINWHPGFQYPLQPTVRLGEHLYVAVVTLTLPLTANGQSIAGLVPGDTYAYNLFFYNNSTGQGQSTSLADPALELVTASNDHPLGYAPGFLPSFSIAPEDFNQLNILHGSCRKPHGQGKDMLTVVDQMIEARRTNPDTRPHLLVLSGDQIYADDVSPTLLKVLHDTGNALLGWTETFPGTGYSTQAVEDLITGIEDAADETIQNMTQTALEGLNNALSSAISNMEFSENAIKNFAMRRLVQWQLSSYLDEVEELLDEIDGPVTTAHQDSLKAIAREVRRWLAQNREIWEDIRSDQHWGRSAVAKDLGNNAANLSGLKNDLGGMRTALNTLTSDHQDTLGQILNQLNAHLDLSDQANQGYKGHTVRGHIEYFASRVARLPQPPNLTRAALRSIVEEMDAWLVMNLPESSNDTDVFTYVASRIAPPQRADELKEFAELTSDEMAAHLMFLAEFYMMYLFTWSDAPWPRDADGNIALPPFYEAVPNYGLTGALGPSGLQEDHEGMLQFASDLPRVRRALANVPVLMIFDDHEVSDDWNLNLDWVVKVNNSVMGPQFLRNALAACAVFQDWGNQPDDYLIANPSPLGRQLLDQLIYPGGNTPPPIADHTGNGPAQFSSIIGVGPEVATELSNLNPNSSQLLNLVDFVDEAPNDRAFAVVAPAGRKRWDWEYMPRPTSLFKVIALDTRNHRAYPTVQWAARIKVPLSSSPNPQTGGYVGPAVLIQPDELQRQLAARLSSQALNLVISPAPVFGLPLVEEVFQRASVLSSGPEVADYEAWIGNPDGLRRVFDALTGSSPGGPRVVLISGDVHYAYSNSLAFNGPGSSIIQLCSSSLKNETAMTRGLGYLGRGSYLRNLFSFETGFNSTNMLALWNELKGSVENLAESIREAYEDLGEVETWLGETASFLPISNLGAFTSYFLALKDSYLFNFDLLMPRGFVTVGSEMAGYVFEDLLGLRSSTPTAGIDPLAGHQVVFATDGRTLEQLISDAEGLNPAGAVQALADREFKLSQMRETVGFSNLGRVTFSPGKVRHELYWYAHDKRGEPEAVLSSTRHEFDLAGAGAAPVPAPSPSTSGIKEFQAEMARIAIQQYERWHPPGRSPIKENTPEGLAILEEYWSLLTPKNEQLKAVPAFVTRDSQGNPIAYQILFNGVRNQTTGSINAWSAVFISNVLIRAGAGDTFFYSPFHIDYMRRAKANQVGSVDNPFYLYPLDAPEAAPQVGDITAGYQMGTPPFTYGEIETEDLLARRSTHCDIVVEVSNTQVTVIGGNLSDTVGRTTYPLTNGKLTPTATNGLVGLIRVRREP